MVYISIVEQKKVYVTIYTFILTDSNRPYQSPAKCEHSKHQFVCYAILCENVRLIVLTEANAVNLLEPRRKANETWKLNKYTETTAVRSSATEV